MWDEEGWVPNPPVFVGESVRASLVLDSAGEPFYLKTKTNPVGFNLKGVKTDG